jgi:dipeptidase D
VSDPLAGLEPALLWERFSELTRIARPPKAEEAVSEHVLAWAANRSLDARVDGVGNVVVHVPATPGRESAPAVVLQAHLDMVCERDPSSPFDPREGRIDVRVDGDWVIAAETTLGADNGIGVAAAMAVVDESDVGHGPLELLFTVSEEQGLDGAKALDASFVSGRLLVNLDGTSDEALTVGCAGSIHTFVRRSYAAEISQSPGLEIRLFGARGGHSGGDIASGRVNANKVVGSILSRVASSTPFRVVLLEGGVSRNAIPREARAIVAVAENDLEDFRAGAFAEFDVLRTEHTETEPQLALALEPCELRYATDASSTAALLQLLDELPTGVLAMRSDDPAVVETSTSLTVVDTDEDHSIVTFGSMTRSSSAAALEQVLSTIAAIAEKADAEVEVRRSYPPWEPQLDSRLLRTAQATFERLNGAAPGLAVVHGGLECAVLGERLPGVEMVSIGPEIVGPHAPGEKVRISSTQRFYRLLGALLDDLS